jgi:hypothetical protein
VAVFDTLIYGGPLRSGYRPGEIAFSLGALGPNLRYMPAHLIQAMPVLVLGLGALAGITLTWLRRRHADGQRAAAARRDLAVALALAACWAGIWVLYATYTWTAAPRLSTLQAVRFYVPALGAISLLGAWLLVRVPRRQPFIAITVPAVVAALFGLGGWAFHDMYTFPFEPPAPHRGNRHHHQAQPDATTVPDHMPRDPASSTCLPLAKRAGLPCPVPLLLPVPDVPQVNGVLVPVPGQRELPATRRRDHDQGGVNLPRRRIRRPGR